MSLFAASELCSVSITVDGTNTFEMVDAYTYASSWVTDIFPNFGVQHGGTLLTITGTELE